MKLWMLVPALGSVMVLAVFLLGLQRDNATILPSALLNKPVPEFQIAALRDGEAPLSADAMREPGVKLVNVWASWCGPCRIEHPNIEALAREGITVHGINYKDDDANAEAFLKELGDPYTLIGADRAGRGGIEWGVYGVPETFVIDGDGTIVYKHVGPIVQRDMAKMRKMIAKAAE
ncbi:MAG: DsbE family thiol:disulfide interchange protein [Pseudomonadota bacterium]